MPHFLRVRKAKPNSSVGEKPKGYSKMEVAPVNVVNAWTGQDWALLLGGITVLITGLAGFITSMVTLFRLGRLDVKVDGMLVQRDASNRAAGEVVGRQAGDDASAQRAQGRREEQERTALHNAPAGAAPLPVADDRTAVAAERGATANERIADAAETKT